MSSEIKTVNLTSLDPNPLRLTKRYPFNEDKIATLRRSIKDVGLWEGVIVRKVGGRYQTAFGHHRVEAARKEFGRDARIPVIVRDLTDEQMIQFMGRENLEDYSADFLVMLNAWEGAEIHLFERSNGTPQAVDIARLLGWTRPAPKGHAMVNQTAEAASAASRLIKGGFLDTGALEGLNVQAVREICQRVLAQHEMLDRMAKTTHRPAAEVTRAKKLSAQGGKRAAKDVRAGRLATRDIRGALDVHAYKAGREKKSPLFAMFAKSLADQVHNVCNEDNIKAKFEQIKQALPMLTEDDDVALVKELSVKCEAAALRFEKWQQTFTNPKRKVVSLKQIGGRS